MKSLIAIFALLFSVSSFASYTCNDRDYLRQMLKDLESSCGSTTLCKAAGYAGSSIESAIDVCSKSYGVQYCAANVICNSGTAICKAAGFAGSSVELAIKSCSGSYGEAYCAANVTCESLRVCKAAGYAGSTVESAIAVCSKSYGAQYCAANVICN